MDADGDDEQLSARNMIEVLGAEAPTVARDNVRATAFAGRQPQARHWIRVLEIIQHIQTRKTSGTPH